MSLINEALRKARLEAARQDAAQRGLGYPGAHEPRRGNRLALAATAAAAVVVLGGVLYWLGMRAASPTGSLEAAAGTAGSGNASTESPTPPVDTAPVARSTEAKAPGLDSTPSPPPPSTSPAAGETRTLSKEPAPRPESRSSPPSRTASPAASPPRPGGVDDAPVGEPSSPSLPEPAATAAVTDPEPVTTRRPEPAETRHEREPEPEQELEAAAPSEPLATTAPEPTDGAGDAQTAPAAATAEETFVREASIPGVGNLRLGGIAWSERQPYALINGRVLGPGDRIQGLQVSAVERTQVKLRDAGGATYVLRIR